MITPLLSLTPACCRLPCVQHRHRKGQPRTVLPTIAENELTDEDYDAQGEAGGEQAVASHGAVRKAGPTVDCAGVPMASDWTSKDTGCLRCAAQGTGASPDIRCIHTIGTQAEHVNAIGGSGSGSHRTRAVHVHQSPRRGEQYVKAALAQKVTVVDGTRAGAKMSRRCEMQYKCGQCGFFPKTTKHDCAKANGGAGAGAPTTKRVRQTRVDLKTGECTAYHISIVFLRSGPHLHAHTHTAHVFRSRT